jgi:hypothetical protein
MNSTRSHKNRMGSKSTWYQKAMGVSLIPGLFIFLSACDVLDPEEQIPAYMEIDAFTLTVDPVSDGSASARITDAWVYSDGELIGVFELPCKFPVLQEGFHNFIIKPGIKVNGISGSRGYYPFYVPFEQRIELIAGQSVKVTPGVSYYPGKVKFIEDFEDGGIAFVSFGDSDTNIVKTSDPASVFEGSYSGLMNVNATDDYFFIATADAYDLPKIGTPVFLEMNYKTELPLIVGLIAIINSENQKKEVMVLNANSEWNKVYINLTGVTSSNQSASNFKLYFEVYGDSDSNKRQGSAR